MRPRKASPTRSTMSPIGASSGQGPFDDGQDGHQPRQLRHQQVRAQLGIAPPGRGEPSASSTNVFDIVMVLTNSFSLEPNTGSPRRDRHRRGNQYPAPRSPKNLARRTIPPRPPEPQHGCTRRRFRHRARARQTSLALRLRFQPLVNDVDTRHVNSVDYHPSSMLTTVFRRGWVRTHDTHHQWWALSGAGRGHATGPRRRGGRQCQWRTRQGGSASESGEQLVE